MPRRQAEITELEHKCAAATSADDLMKCYDQSNDLVVYDLTARRASSTDATRCAPTFRTGFDAFQNPKIEFINLHVITDGKLGVAESVQHMTATDKSGKPIDMIFRVTDVWRKEKGGWKIIHSHISVPGGHGERQGGHAIEVASSAGRDANRGPRPGDCR